MTKAMIFGIAGLLICNGLTGCFEDREIKYVGDIKW